MPSANILTSLNCQKLDIVIMLKGWKKLYHYSMINNKCLITVFFCHYSLTFFFGKHSLVFRFFCVVHARSIVLQEKQMHLPQQNFVFWSYMQFIIYHSENPSLVLPWRPVRREVIINKYLNICLWSDEITKTWPNHWCSYNSNVLLQVMNFLQQLNMSGIFKMCKQIIDICFSLLIVAIQFWLMSLCLFLFLQVGRRVSTGHLLVSYT